MNSPASDLRAYRFDRLIANCGQKTDKECSITAYCGPSPKGKPEKIEFLVRIIAPSDLILTIDDLCLFWMQF